jgi:DNA polymerase III subunit epsilon
MREIVFDTETTGLDARADRVIEIGGVELVNRFPTGRTFHEYINPQGRSVHPEALAIHGISDAQLAGKPTLVAHNASFDIAFINAEFERLGQGAVAPERVVDTLAIAKRKHPMGPNSLDALCRRYGIDNSHRTKHGALLDSELLAEVYIELVGGRQAALGLDIRVDAEYGGEAGFHMELEIVARTVPLAPRISELEREAHAKMVAGLGENALWAKFRRQAAAA